MTLEEYNKGITEYYDFIMNDPERNDVLWQEMFEYQYCYLTDIIEDWGVKTKTEAELAVLKILKGMRDYSVSGNYIIEVDTEEIARETDQLLFDNFRDMLLESNVYQDYRDSWSVDVIFGGFYVPGWEGFDEQWKEKWES